MNRWILRAALPVALMGSASVATPSAAGADVRVVSTVTVALSTDSSGQPDTSGEAPQPKSVTTYFKGERIRVEQQDGPTTIYDLSSSKVYVLDIANKTYSLLKLSDYLEHHNGVASAAGAAAVPANAKPEVTLSLTKDTVVQGKTIAGRDATVYDLTGTIARHPQSQGGGGGFGGGGFGGGGFGRRHGGGGGGGGGNRSQGGSLSATVSGEVWMSSAISVKAKSGKPEVALMSPAVPVGLLAMPLTDRVDGAKAFPLATRVTVTWRSRNPSDQDSRSVTINTEVKSVAEEPLDDSLFTIPSDYARQDAP